MPLGPAGGSRPGTDSSLLLVIREIPVVGAQPEGVFPEPLIRNGAYEEDIIEDIAERTVFDESEISVNISNKFRRGLGQTDTYEIRINVSGMHPEDVDDEVYKLSGSGYVFERVELE